MTGPYQLAAAQGRAAAAMSAHQATPEPTAVGLVIVNVAGTSGRIVGPFASEATALQWVKEHRPPLYWLFPHEMPGPA